MHPHITCVGELAKQSLRGVNNRASGTVIAVFESSVYLEISGTDDLICLGTDALVDGPVNVRTSVLQLPSIYIGNQWQCREDKLSIENGISFQYKTDLLIDTTRQILPISIPVEPHHIEMLRLHLTQRNTQTAFNQKLADCLQRRHQPLTQWLQSKPGTPPTQELEKIIGYGEGLTPSGDDILIGALITLKHAKRAEHFEALSCWIKTHAATLTNRISLAHLLAACNGQAVVLLHDVLNAISHSDKTLVQRALTELEHYGHNSGNDALRGILAVIDSGTVSQREL